MHVTATAMIFQNNGCKVRHLIYKCNPDENTKESAGPGSSLYALLMFDKTVIITHFFTIRCVCET